MKKAEGKRAEIKIGVDSSGLDEAIKKASQLKGLLEDIDSLQRELGIKF